MDWSLFRSVNSLAKRTSWAHGVVRANANYGIALFAVLLAVAGVIALRRNDARAFARSVWAAVGALISLALNQPIANAVDRARPYVSHPHILHLVDKTTDPSFMSDHSIVAGAVAAGLLLAVRRIGLVAIGLALLMAFTRVYVGAHYPSDVLAGLVFSAAFTAATIPVADRLITPLASTLFDTPIVRRFRPPISN